MAALDFNKALDVKASEVKAVPVPPTGHYVFQVTGIGEINNDNETWWMVNIPVQAVGAFEDADDVDMDALREYGKADKIRTRVTFMVNKKEGTDTDVIAVQNRIKKFCVDTLGVEDGDEKSLRELLSSIKAKRFVGQITHTVDRRDPSGETLQFNIGRTAPLDK